MKKTVPYIIGLKGNRVISMMTAYDYPTAKAVSEAEIDIILVGDSLAQVVLGHDDTLSVTVDEMLHHVKAVTNASPASLVVADMPYLSYHINVPDSLKNAGRFIQEGKADAVKICQDDQDIMLSTKFGKCIRFKSKKLRLFKEL